MRSRRSIDEIEAPLRILEAEIGQIRATIERGKALSVSDHDEKRTRDLRLRNAGSRIAWFVLLFQL